MKIAKNLLKVGGLFTLALCALAASPIESSSPPDDLVFGGNWPDPSRVTIPTDELIFHPDSMSNYESESVYFMSQFNDGWMFMSSLFVWKYGPMQRWGVYTLVVSPQGKRYWAREQLDEKNVKIASDHLQFLQGPNFVESKKGEYRFKIQIKGFGCDLTYKNNVPEWKPGTGYAYYDKEKKTWQYTGAFSPWADVSGTITLPDQTLQVKGEGYADKARATVFPTKLSPYIIDFRVFSPPGTPKEDRWFLAMLEYRMHPGYGSKRVPFIHLCHNNKILFGTKNYEIETTDWAQGPNTPYQYPKRIKIRAKERGYTLEGVYLSSSLFDFVDIMAEVPMWVKKIIEQFVKRPVFFRSRGHFEGVLTYPDGRTATIKLVGPTEYVVAK